jgi:hypothetical protein
VTRIAFIVAGAMFALIIDANAQPQSRREELANAELHNICHADRSRLWGASLCGPLLVADPQTRLAWASEADRDGVLARQGAGWVGVLPNGIGIANTSTDWAGVRWIMIMGPLPADAEERRVLVAHEAWHRIQTQIGFPQAPSDCAHLETEHGRTLMRLEMRALEQAMRETDAARWAAARHALGFRAARFAEFAAARANEVALDRNEGLASYTGVKLGAGRDAFVYAANSLHRFDRHQALARSYAYATGPAYGLLLDQRDGRWRRRLNEAAPADALARLIGATSNVASVAARYGGAAVASEESARAEAAASRIAEFRARFATGPRLVLPLRGSRMEFDPNAVTPVEGLGSVYRTLVIRDAWGELRATQGAMIAADFTQVIAAAPNADGLTGPGWTLTLNPGYRLGGASNNVRTLAQ